MLTYYKQGADGKITDVIGFYDEADVNDWVKANYIAATKEIIQKADGSYAFAEDVNADTEATAKAALELAAAKEAKIAELKEERDRREQMPVEYNGASYDYDLKSAFKLDKARTRITVRKLDNQPWIDADSEIQALTIADINEIDALAADRSNALHMQYAELKIYISALTTVEAVRAVTFDTEIAEPASEL